MDIFVTGLFSLLFSVIGVSNYPTYSSDMWQIENTWIKNNDQYSTNLISKKIGKLCDSNPDEYIVFPQVIHSYQEIFVDGKLVSSFGNKTFSIASPFYEKNYISCRILKSAETVEWHASTYSQFFARIKSYPVLSKNPFSQNIFSVTANILAFGSLLVLSIFCLYLFYGKVTNTLTYSISASAFFLSIYFLNTVNSFFNLSISMEQSHRLADTCLWLGGGLITASYYYDKLLNKKFLFFFTLRACPHLTGPAV